MKGVPDLRLAGMATGTWLAAVIGLPHASAISCYLALGAAAVAGVLAFTGRGFGAGSRDGGAGDRRRDGVRWIGVAVLLGAVCGAASTAAHLRVRSEEPFAALAAHHATVSLTLTVGSDPHEIGGAHLGPPTYALDATVTELRTATLVARSRTPVFVLASGTGWSGLLPGQRLATTGRLGVPEPGELDAAVVNVSGAPRLLGHPPLAQRAAGSLRAGLRRACAGLPQPVRGLLPGLIDGDTSGLDPNVSQAFRTTGMTHMVAVSGSNVIMIVGVVLFAARWCRAGPAVSAGLCVLALIGFVVLVRPTPSVLRAAAMGGIGLLAQATGRVSAALPALSAIIIGLLAYDPGLATDPGFGLSVFATAGLLLIAPHWQAALRRRGVPGILAEALAVPAAAQVACSPMIAGLSGTVSLIAIPANLLTVPAVPVATIVGVAAAVVSPVWPGAAAACAWVASWPARWLLLVAERGAAAPGAVAAWPGGWPGGLTMAVALIVGAVLLRYRPVRIGAGVALVAAVATVAPIRVLTGGWPPPGALLVMCDVGQGDGMVLPVGGGAGVVVDTGPEPTAIDGCLDRLGITDIPYLFLTHFHEDHVGGITGALDGRRVGAIVTSPFDQPDEGYHDVVTAAAARHIPMSVPSLGQVFTIGALRLTVLGPIGRITGTRSDPNNNSIVMRADEDGLRILLTGDAEIEEQTQVLATAGADALRADILKMPHHGSSYQNPAFLAAVRPAAVLVSVGAVNPYGLPNLPTLARLAAGGARVLRTDTSGDIAVLATDGRAAVQARGLPPGRRSP